MRMPLSSHKLRNEHLTRPALVYVRQSSLMQVRDNTASITSRNGRKTSAGQPLWWSSLIKIKAVQAPRGMVVTALNISWPKSVWDGLERCSA